MFDISGKMKNGMTSPRNSDGSGSRNAGGTSPRNATIVFNRALSKKSVLLLSPSQRLLQYSPRTAGALRTPPLKLEGFSQNFIYNDGSIITFAAEDSKTTKRADNTFVCEYVRGSIEFLDFPETPVTIGKLKKLSNIEQATEVYKTVQLFTKNDEKLFQWIIHNTTLNALAAKLNIHIIKAIAAQGCSISPKENQRLTKGEIYRNEAGVVTFFFQVVCRELVLMDLNGIGSKTAYPDDDDNPVTQHIFIIEAHQQADGNYRTKLITEEFICYNLDLMPYIYHLVEKVFLYRHLCDLLEFLSAQFKVDSINQLVIDYKGRINSNHLDQDYLKTFREFVNAIRQIYEGLSPAQVKLIEQQINEVIRKISFNIPINAQLNINEAVKLSTKDRLKLIPRKFSLKSDFKMMKGIFLVPTSSVNESGDGLLSNRRHFLLKREHDLAISIIHDAEFDSRIISENIKGLIIQPCYYRLIEENELVDHFIGLLEQKLYYQFILRKQIPLYISLPKYGIYHLPEDYLVDFISKHLEKITKSSAKNYVEFLLVINKVVCKYSENNTSSNNLDVEDKLRVVFEEFYQLSFQCYLKYLAYEAAIVKNINEICLLDSVSSEAKARGVSEKLDRLSIYRAAYLEQKNKLSLIIQKNNRLASLVESIIQAFAEKITILAKYNELKIPQLFSALHHKTITMNNIAYLDSILLGECHTSTKEAIAFIRIAYCHQQIQNSSEKDLTNKLIPNITTADKDSQNPKRWQDCVLRLTSMNELALKPLETSLKPLFFSRSSGKDLKSTLRQILAMDTMPTSLEKIAKKQF